MFGKLQDPSRGLALGRGVAPPYNASKVHQRLDQYWGIRPAMSSAPMYGDGPGSYEFEDYNAVDQNYRNRRILTLSDQMQQHLKNEMHGLPLVTLLTQVTFSNEIQWRMMGSSIILATWDEIGPTGIARNMQHEHWVEDGKSNRYGKRVEIPLAAIEDPNFGAQQLWTALEPLRTTVIHHIMIFTAMALAHRPMYEEQRAFLERNPAAKYGFVHVYNRCKDTLFLAAKSPEALGIEVLKQVNSMPLKDSIIFPDVAEYQMRSYRADQRAFLHKTVDYTKGDTNHLTISDKTEELQLFSDVSLSFGTSDTLVGVKCPTFKRSAREPDEYGMQPLRRRFVLAQAYFFEPPAYGNTDTYAPTESQCTLTALNVAPDRAKWDRISLAAAAKSNGLGGAFVKAAKGWVMSTEYAGALVKYQESAQGKAVFNARFGLVNMDTIPRSLVPNNSALISDLAHRSQPMFSHWTVDPTGKGVLKAVAYVGQMEEYHLPTDTLLDIARMLQRHVMSLDGSGTAMDEKTRLREFLSRLFVLSDIAVTELIAAFEQLIVSEATGVDTYDKQLRAAMVTYSTIRHNPGTLGTIVRNGDTTTVTPARNVTFTPVIGGVLFKSGIYPLMTRVPNMAYEALEPLADTFVRLEQEQPAIAKAIVDHMTSKFVDYDKDAGKAEVYAKHAVESLASIGIVPLANDAVLPNLAKEDITKFKKQVPKGETIINATRLEEPGSPAFSLASALVARSLASGAPLGKIVRDERYATFGQRATFADTTYYPLSLTRAAKAEELEGVGGLVLLLFVGICAQPMDPITVARFAQHGIMLVAGHLDRYCINGTALSMIAMKRGVETVETMLTPISTYFSMRGADGWADYSSKFHFGHKWNSRQNMHEIYGVFPDRFFYGMNTRMMQSWDELREIVSANGMQPHHSARADFWFWPEPVSATRYIFPLDLTGSTAVTAEKGDRGAETELNMASTAYASFRLMEPGLVHQMVTQLDMAAKSPTGDTEVDFMPLVERGFSYSYNSSTRLFDNPHPGTGPLGKNYVNDDNTISDILNGRGTEQFPGQLSLQRAPV